MDSSRKKDIMSRSSDKISKFFNYNYKQVGSLFGWRCQIPYANIGDISSQRRIDYNEETYW